MKMTMMKTERTSLVMLQLALLAVLRTPHNYNKYAINKLVLRLASSSTSTSSATSGRLFPEQLRIYRESKPILNLSSPSSIKSTIADLVVSNMTRAFVFDTLYDPICLAHRAIDQTLFEDNNVSRHVRRLVKFFWL
jgi:hypothetical protein